MDTFEDETTPVGDALIHASAAGPADGDPVVLLHGWPQDAGAWTAAMHRGAAAGRRMIALDLPGIGRSRIPEPNGDKEYLAGLIHDWLVTRDLHDVTLVGHDAGGMIAWAMLRRRDIAQRVRNVVVMDTVIPGIDPLNAVLANPYIWHFAFHSIPELPETLVADRLPEYLDYFFDVITARPDALTAEARRRYVEAYSGPSALRQGFEFYRPCRTTPGPTPRTATRSTSRCSTCGAPPRAARWTTTPQVSAPRGSRIYGPD